MAGVTICPSKGGPYIVEGEVNLYSSNKPFCDGTQSQIGFQAAESINPPSAE